MKTPIPDKNRPKEILLKKGYTIKYYNIRRMEGYSKDGKRLENKIPDDSSELGIRKDMFKLKGKYCEVNFSHEHPVIFHGFRTAAQKNLQYNLAENLTEVRSVINMLNQFANYDVSPCELLISLDVKGRQNSDMTFLKMQKITSDEFSIRIGLIFWQNKKKSSQIPSEKLIRSPPPSAAEHLEVRYHGDSDWISDNIESIIRARNGKYVMTLRFNSTGTESALEDLKKCEEFGLKIIEKLESVSKLD